MTSQNGGRISFSDLRPGPGETARGLVTIPGTDPAWEVPAWVVRGAEPGPALAVTAGVHAGEYPPIGAATRFARELDPARLRGTVAVVSVVNTPGLFARSLYVNPRDGQNINRLFPGKADGLPSERVANFLIEELIRGSNAYLDLHCGDLVEALEPFGAYQLTGDTVLDQASRRLADAYGVPHINERPASDGAGGTAYAAGARAGTPSALVEIGGQGIFDPAAVDRHLRGLRNVLAALGMVDEPYIEPAPAATHTRSAWLSAPEDGFWLPAVSPGATVTEGQDLGEFQNIFGDTLTRLAAPVSGVVLWVVTSLAVPRGGPLLSVAAT